MDPTERFTGCAEQYSRSRPGYPSDVLGFMRAELGLTAAHVVADVGSGTGILSQLFLDNGNVVYGVEPNRAMCVTAERLLSRYDRFRSVAGTAEATLLEAAQVDFVVVGQAFHWFDVAGARTEFIRILRSDGWVVVIWNTRRTEGTPFLRTYEAFLMRWGTDYPEVRSRYDVRASLASFFGGEEYGKVSFENAQKLDFEGLRGRLLSSSYIPDPRHPRHGPMLEAIHELFDAHERDGQVLIEYDTEVYYGRLA